MSAHVLSVKPAPEARPDYIRHTVVRLHRASLDEEVADRAASGVTGDFDLRS